LDLVDRPGVHERRNSGDRMETLEVGKRIKAETVCSPNPGSDGGIRRPCFLRDLQITEVDHPPSLALSDDVAANFVGCV